MHWVRNGSLALAVVLVALVVWFGLQPQVEPLPINDRMGGAVTLIDQNGESFNTASLEGRVALLFFGYTHCPDICPATLARVTQAWKKLREAGHGEETALVFITFDPERDTPAHMKEYLAFFDEKIIGLTGSKEQINAAAEKYGVVFMEDNHESGDGNDGEAQRLFAHSDFIYLLDKLGRVRKLFSSDANIDEMVDDAKSLL